MTLNSARKKEIERGFLTIPMAADAASRILKKPIKPYQVVKWLTHPQIGNLNGKITDFRAFPIFNYTQEGEKKNIRIMRYWFERWVETLREEQFKPGKKLIEIRTAKERKLVDEVLAKYREGNRGGL